MKKICLTCAKEFNAHHTRTRFCSIFCFHDYPRLQERLTGKKKCNKCLIVKPLEEFYKRTDTILHKGYRGHCKVCEIQASKIYMRKNKEMVKRSDRRRMSTPRGQYNKYKVAAKKFNKLFKLDISYFEKNQIKPCHYCGSFKTDALVMGIDRVNSMVGYVENNCVPCCMKCNMSKFTYCPEEFINHAKQIVNYQRRKRDSKGNR